MLILIIGPSGVGKSSLGNHAGTHILNCRFYDLDHIISREQSVKSASEVLRREGSKRFFEHSCDIVGKINPKCDGQIRLIAVGAGTLEYHESKDWLREHTTISITAPPEEVFPRSLWGSGGNFQGYKNTEYSAYRLSLYESANYRFPVDGLTEEQARRGFVEFLKEVLPRNCSSGHGR